MAGAVEGDRVDVVGMWVTADGHIRQELLPDGRYVEARGERRCAYTGR
jgi:Agrobacterium tumefaciens protein Atu4866